MAAGTARYGLPAGTNQLKREAPPRVTLPWQREGPPWRGAGRAVPQRFSGGVWDWRLGLHLLVPASWPPSRRLPILLKEAEGSALPLRLPWGRSSLRWKLSPPRLTAGGTHRAEEGRLGAARCFAPWGGLGGEEGWCLRRRLLLLSFGHPEELEGCQTGGSLFKIQRKNGRRGVRKGWGKRYALKVRVGSARRKTLERRKGQAEIIHVALQRVDDFIKGKTSTKERTKEVRSGGKKIMIIKNSSLIFIFLHLGWCLHLSMYFDVLKILAAGGHSSPCWRSSSDTSNAAVAGHR